MSRLTAIPGPPGSSFRGRRRATRAEWARAASHLLLGVLPLPLIGFLVVLFRSEHIFALDFHNWYWPAARQMLDGQSPYAQPYPWGFNYPAFAGLLFVPFALLPHATADVVFTLLALLSVPLTLRLLEIRDWRIYGAVMLWTPVVFGWQTANVSLLLVLGVAAMWRWRDRALLAGLIVALLVSVKVFLWPLGLWLLFTRRYRATAYAVLLGLILSLGAFAVTGFGELTQYMSQLHSFMADAERRSYSVFSLALHLGAGHTAAYVVLVTTTAAAVAALIALCRRGHERAAISAAIAASLLGSPIVEAHYVALLLVPMSLTYRRLNRVWLVPLALWITPADWPSDWQRMFFLALTIALLALTASRGLPRPSLPRLRILARFRAVPGAARV